MVGQYEELSCPFCHKGRIPALYIPSVTSFKKERSKTFGSKTKRAKSPDIWLIKSGCHICGKSQDEVEKELKKKDLI